MTTQSIDFKNITDNGVYMLNTPLEVLEYCEYAQEYIDNIENKNDDPLYDDILYILFSIFEATYLIQYSQVYGDKKQILTKIHDIMDELDFKQGAGSRSLVDLVIDDNLCNVQYVYNLFVPVPDRELIQSIASEATEFFKTVDNSIEQSYYVTLITDGNDRITYESGELEYYTGNDAAIEVEIDRDNITFNDIASVVIENYEYLLNDM